jgi:hypothetical protein
VGELERGDVVLAYYVGVAATQSTFGVRVGVYRLRMGKPAAVKPGGACGALADPLDWFDCPVLVTVVLPLCALSATPLRRATTRRTR